MEHVQGFKVFYQVRLGINSLKWTMAEAALLGTSIHNGGTLSNMGYVDQVRQHTGGAFWHGFTVPGGHSPLGWYSSKHQALTAAIKEGSDLVDMAEQEVKRREKHLASLTQARDALLQEDK